MLARKPYVFISYKTEEREVAQRVRGALSLATKCEIWWDQDLQAGGVWSAALDVAVRDAACVIVLWSQLSIQSPWVLQEAAVAKAMEKLVPVAIDECAIPAPYQQLQTAQLAGWNGRETAAEFVKLAAAVGAMVRRRRRPVLSGRSLLAMSSVALVAGVAVGHWGVPARAGSLPTGNECMRQLERLESRVQLTGTHSDLDSAIEVAVQVCRGLQ